MSLFCFQWCIIAVIEWKYNKQLFQVQKGVYQVVKFNDSKKWQKQIIFMVKLSIKFVFVVFSQNRVLRPDTHLFGLKTAVFDISTQFPQWGIYIYPCWYWKGKIRKNRIHQTKLPVWPIYGSTVTFMAFKLKSMAFPIKLTANDPNEGKKLWNFEILGFGLWVWPSKFFSAFFYFFDDFWCLRSPVVCKNNICE